MSSAEKSPLAIHANAPLTSTGRLRMVKRHLEGDLAGRAASPDPLLHAPT